MSKITRNATITTEDVMYAMTQVISNLEQMSKSARSDIKYHEKQLEIDIANKRDAENPTDYHQNYHREQICRCECRAMIVEKLALMLFGKSPKDLMDGKREIPIEWVAPEVNPI